MLAKWPENSSTRSQHFYFGKLQTTYGIRRRVIFAFRSAKYQSYSYFGNIARIILKCVKHISEVSYVKIKTDDNTSQG